MVQLYRRPADALPLTVTPRLASWDRMEHPSQRALADFLAHLDVVTAPALAAADGPLVVELIAGFADDVPLTGGGRDLDHYLYPVAQRLGPARLAAVFGRKIHGLSSVAVGAAQPTPVVSAPQFTTRISGSYERKAWKETLRDRLLQQQVTPARAGPVTMDIAVTTAAGRNWANLWKPLIDAFGPVLGEDAHRAFHPHDDRIVDLGLHHRVVNDIGHDVIVDAWWATA